MLSGKMSGNWGLVVWQRIPSADNAFKAAIILMSRHERRNSYAKYERHLSIVGFGATESTVFTKLYKI